MVRVGRAMQLAVPNCITALRLALVVAAGTQSLPPSEVLELIILAAVLDLLDGFAARCLSATTTIGALLDLIVDGFMWTACIYLGFMQGGHSRLAIFGWVVLTLEWVCTLCLLHASLCGHCGWKEEIVLGEDAHITRAYISHRMRNPLAALGNISHVVMPMAIYSADRRLFGEARGPYLYLVALLALPGFLLYCFVTWQLLRAHLERYVTMRCPRHLWPLAVYHAATGPLVLRPLVSSHLQSEETSVILFKALASRLLTAALVAFHHHDQATRIASAHPSTARRVLSYVSDGWVFFHWQQIYWEVGALLPVLHPTLFTPAYDLGLDEWVRSVERHLFGFEPAASLRAKVLSFLWPETAGDDSVGGTAASLLSESLYVVYFGFVPLLAATAACFRVVPALRRWSPLYEANVTSAYGACALWWLCAPVFGPAVTIGPPRTATRGLAAATQSAAAAPSFGVGGSVAMASHVWGLGKKFASVGTALPSSHCAVTAAMLLSVFTAGREAAAEAKATHVKTKAASDRGDVVIDGRGDGHGGGGYASYAAHVALPLAYGAVVVAIWFSTVYCGFHYVSDVLCGVGLAAAVGSWRSAD